MELSANNIMFQASQPLSITGEASTPEAQPNLSGDWSSLMVELPFPAVVRGMEKDGQSFEEETVLESLSTYHVCLGLSRQVTRGTKLFIVVRLSPLGSDGAYAPVVALRGLVLEAQAEPDGRYRVEIGFKRHRFLYAAQAPVQ